MRPAGVGGSAAAEHGSAGTTTGISAHDRALTARQLAAASANPDDFTRPGHMVPLRARSGGVLERTGHTESGVGAFLLLPRFRVCSLGTDLCRLTGLPPAGVLCEIVNDDDAGSMARRDDCRAFADRWGIKMISVEMLVQYRQQHEQQQTA